MSRTLHLGDARADEATLVDLCRRFQVRELSLFGSAAQGEMRPDSDIDLLIEFLPHAENNLVDYAGLTLDGLKPLIRPSVLAEARLLYAA